MSRTTGDVSFAEALNLLFSKVRNDNGNEYTERFVAAAIQESGGEITNAYINQLRTGARANPRASYVKSLAQFFNVPAGFFMDHEVFERWRDHFDGVEHPQAEVPAPRGKQGVLLRSLSGISDDGQSALRSLINYVSELEREKTGNAP